MKKLSKITESIWSDIQKRSTGEIRRKEDDINLLDETGLVDYIKKVYISSNVDTYIIGDTLDQGSILASLFNVDGRYCSIVYKKISTNKPEITFPVCQESDIENKLSKLYKVTRLKQYHDKIYKIEPNDGNKITNKFFIEVLDFILNNVEDGINGINKILFKKANESIWSDIQKRSTGEIRRKEDDINNLDFGDFFQYIKDNYELCIPNKFFQIGQWLDPNTCIGNISIPIEKNNPKDTPNMSNRMLTIQKDLKNRIYHTDKDADKEGEMWIKPNKYIFRLYPNELRKTFSTDKYDFDVTPGGDGEIILVKGEITNQVCIDVLDKLLGMVEEPILKKKK